MSFGSSVILGDLSDYISPSQACVNPIFSETVNSTEKKKQVKKGSAKITIDLEDDVATADGTGAGSKQANLILESKIQTAQISLNDCLACSGCVTSAETVLIEQQSADAFFKAADGCKMLVVSISEEARASLASHYGISSGSVHWRLRSFFRNVMKRKNSASATSRVVIVLDAAVATDVALVESRLEFVERFRNSRKGSDSSKSGKRKKSRWTKPSVRTMAISATKERVLRPGSVVDFDAAAEHARTAAQSAAVVAASLPPAKRAREPGPHVELPMIVSACPGWVCYAEKRHPEALPFMSSTKSPQQILGTFAKLRLPHLVGRSDVSPKDILHVSVMACFDKKLEASRLDFWHDSDQREWTKTTKDASSSSSSSDGVHEVDLVLTSGEIVKMLEERKIDFRKLPVNVPGASDLDRRLSNFHDEEVSFGSTRAERGGSGGFADHIFRWAARELFGISIPSEPLLYTSPRRCNSDFQETRLIDPADGKTVLMTFATVYGFRHIQRIIRQLRSGTCKYDFIEMMACPGGCLNGGGQARPKDFVSVDAGKLLAGASASFATARPSKLLRDPSESPLAREVATWLGKSFDAGARAHLHTRYHAIPEMPKNPLAISW